MRKFKTREAYRNTYIYHFSDGTTKTIEVCNEVTLEDIAFLHQLDDEEIDQERRQKYLVPSYLEEFAFNDENDQLPTNPLLVDERTPTKLFEQYEKREQKKRMIRVLQKALKKLTPNQRQTIEKIFYQGMNQFEVAREEKISRAAIFYRLEGAYKRIKKEIEKNL